ncbi:MAG: C10 family peptidase [Bacteroidales bacterium]|nr:C10 family peptidase [Bacteroidales bacterium]
MKKLIITIAALFAALISFADTIDRQQAQAIAQRWLGAEVTEAAYGSDAFFIFNGKTGGWVIISAEDFATPVLGYNDTGSFNLDRLPSNLKHWMGGYEKDIRAARADKQKATTEVKALWKTAGYRTKSAAGKLLETPLWDQDEPYNLKCPKVVENGKTYTAVTGCVATAMAEIIRYHQWPEHGTGTLDGYSYQSDYRKTITIEGYSIDSHVYDYSLMPFEYKGSENSAQRNAVAQLMYDCGVMVQAYYNYGSGTGTYSEYIINALSTHMSYSADARLVYRQYCTDAEWVRLIEKEIDEDRPVLYGGVDPESGGHQFVCDGYDTKDYVHINWGWSGDGNGYFTLTLNIPGKYTFSDDQCAILNLRPDRQGDSAIDPYVCLEAIDSKGNGLTLKSGSVLSKRFSLKAESICNPDWNLDYSGAFKAVLIDWKGTYKEDVSEVIDLQLQATNLIAYDGIDCRIKGDVVFGDRVVLYFRNSAGGWERMRGKEAYDFSRSQTNPTLRFISSSVPAVDASFILLPESPKAGDTYFFELIPGSVPVKSTIWYYDGKKQESVSANLTAGTHTIKASVTYNDGSKENLTAQILVK